MLFPKQLDWRVEGGVPPIRDQGNCGSCWTFGTASVLESRVNRYFINNRTKPLFQMSEQSIINCLWSVGDGITDGLNGCDGGFADEAMNRIIDDFGGKLAKLSDNPYVGEDMRCNKSLWNYDEVVLESFSYTQAGNFGELKYALLSGPVTIGVTALQSMVFYSGGIYDDPECTNSNDTINHQVVVVGWGRDDTVNKSFWIIRNSWSNLWGIDGYIYILMDYDVDYCGVT